MLHQESTETARILHKWWVVSPKATWIMRTGTEITLSKTQVLVVMVKATTISITHNLMGHNLGLVILQILVLGTQATPMGTLRRAEVTLLTMELALHNNLIIQVITATAILGAVRTITATLLGLATAIITTIVLGAATTIITTIMLGVVILRIATAAVLGTAMAAITTILGEAVTVITTMQHGATAATVRGAVVTAITSVTHLLTIAMLPASAIP